MATAAIALVSVLAYGGAIRLGSHLRLAGASVDPAPIETIVGGNRLALPRNAIRFAEQRGGAALAEVDLYLAWPDLGGFEERRSAEFYAERPETLLFLTLAATGAEAATPASVESGSSVGPSAFPGLWRLSPSDGSVSAGEFAFLADDGRSPRTRVTCLDDRAGVTMAADCIVERQALPGLDMTYRFSQNLLPHWQEIDERIGAWVAAAKKP